MTDELKQLVAKMYNDGWNPEDIADELGIDEMEVINYCWNYFDMETPDKIWINPTLDLPKLNGVIDKDSVQYTRTDAFFKKLEEWLDEYISDMVNVDTRILLESFKNYIKRE